MFTLRLLFGEPHRLADAEARAHSEDKKHLATEHFLQVMKQDQEPTTRLQALQDYLTLYPESDHGQRFYLHQLAATGRKALSGERETAVRLLKCTLWSPPDVHARPIQEKVARLQQRYGL